MKTFVRTIAYSIALCLILGYVSYRVHSSPSQTRLRLQRLLGDILACPASVDGCEQPFLDLLAIRKVEIPACPPIRGPALLRVEDIRMNDTSSRRTFRRILAGDAESAGGPHVTIHASTAALSLEHAGSGAAARWNFDDLFLERGGLARLGEARFQVNLDRASIDLVEAREPGRENAWRFELSEAEVRGGGPSGVSLEFDLAEGEHWAGGHAQGTWHPGKELVLRGGVDDLRRPEAWLPLLGEAGRTFWDVFRPSGAVSIDLEELRIAEGRTPRWKASARHYDTTARLGRLGAEIRHLSGVMRATESAVSLGEKGAGASPGGELWGMPVELTGKVDGSAAELELHVAPARLETIISSIGEPAARDGPLTSLLSGLRPSGVVEGTIRCDLHTDETDTWSAEAQFREVAPGALPCIAAAAGTVSLAGTGKGRIQLDAATCTGLEGARGRIEFTWDNAGIVATLYDLKVGGKEDGHARPEGQTDGGTVFGTLSCGWDGVVGEVDLRWMGVAVKTGLLEAGAAAGSLQKMGAGADGKGKLQFERVLVPGGALGTDSQPMAFESGECAFLLGTTSVEIRMLKLRGAAAALRATGRVDFTGEVALVAFLAQGPRAPAVLDLAEESRPRDWKQTAGDGFRAFRITGSLLKPEVREVGGLDAAFTGDGR